MTEIADDPTNALDVLDALVGFDTVSSKSNLPLIDWVEAFLSGHGIESLRVPNAAGDKAALWASVGPKIDGGVVLSGHTDVVPVAGQAWTGDPFRLRQENGRLYGRGTSDMKGFDAICLASLPILARADLKKPVHLLLSYDEEIGCLGSLDTIARFGADLPRPAIALVGEPTEMAVVDAHKSIATYETVVHGREAHSANPALGANAVEVACMLVAELHRLQAELELEGDESGRFDPAFSTVHVGVIEGGHARNILARTCRFEWEFRGLPGMDLGRALRRFEAYAATEALPHLRRHAPEARIETTADVEVPALFAEAGSAAEVLAKRLARSNEVRTASYATEAGQFQSHGISTVVCGPGSIRQAHQPDEFIELSQIAAGLAFVRRLARELGT